MANPLPETNVQYLQADYWNKRFDSEPQYDWFKDYSQFRHLCIPHLQPADSILILGCGNSTLTQDLYNDGYRNLTSVDLSAVVIDHMRTKAAAASQGDIKWQVGIHRLLDMTVVAKLLLSCHFSASLACAAFCCACVPSMKVLSVTQIT